MSEPEEPEPTLILICNACRRELLFYGAGDDHPEDGAFQLSEYDFVRCECGATYSEGDWLDCKIEHI